MTTAHTPQIGDRKRIVADGHDHAGSLSAARAVERGYIVHGSLTPSGLVIEEGGAYEMEWRERFRAVRSKATHSQLKLRGRWEYCSERIDINT